MAGHAPVLSPACSTCDCSLTVRQNCSTMDDRDRFMPEALGSEPAKESRLRSWQGERNGSLGTALLMVLGYEWWLVRTHRARHSSWKERSPNKKIHDTAAGAAHHDSIVVCSMKKIVTILLGLVGALSRPRNMRLTSQAHRDSRLTGSCSPREKMKKLKLTCSQPCRAFARSVYFRCASV